ncbi:MAG: hypothetical protein AAB223_08465, partial [Pseudomonadota bacterium]
PPTITPPTETGTLLRRDAGSVKLDIQGILRIVPSIAASGAARNGGRRLVGRFDLMLRPSTRARLVLFEPVEGEARTARDEEAHAPTSPA